MVGDIFFSVKTGSVNISGTYSESQGTSAAKLHEVKKPAGFQTVLENALLLNIEKR